MVYDEGCVYCRTDYQILSNKDEITTTGVLPFVEISIPLRDGCCPIWGEGGGGEGNWAIPDRKHFFPRTSSLVKLVTRIPLCILHHSKYPQCRRGVLCPITNITRIANAVQAPSDCQSLTLIVMIAASQFVRNSQLCHCH